MDIAKYIDHTLLKYNGTQSAFIKLAEEAMSFGFATVCVPPSVVQYLRTEFPSLNICSVVGFPCGYSTTATKLAEAQELITNGANELDFVINLQQLHSGNYDFVEQELVQLIAICRGNNICSKIIVESGSLNDEQFDKTCEIINNCRPDFIKTSTGMLLDAYAATPEEISRIRKKINAEIKVKASGGVKTYEQALNIIKAGADRIGTSSSISIIENSI